MNYTVKVLFDYGGDNRKSFYTNSVDILDRINFAKTMIRSPEFTSDAYTVNILIRNFTAKQIQDINNYIALIETEISSTMMLYTNLGNIIMHIENVTLCFIRDGNTIKVTRSG